jgi:hypothetical protein
MSIEEVLRVRETTENGEEQIEEGSGRRRWLRLSKARSASRLTAPSSALRSVAPTSVPSYLYVSATLAAIRTPRRHESRR